MLTSQKGQLSAFDSPLKRCTIYNILYHACSALSQTSPKCTAGACLPMRFPSHSLSCCSRALGLRCVACCYKAEEEASTPRSRETGHSWDLMSSDETMFHVFTRLNTTTSIAPSVCISHDRITLVTRSRWPLPCRLS